MVYLSLLPVSHIPWVLMPALELQVTPGVPQTSQTRWLLFFTNAGLLPYPTPPLLLVPVRISPTLPKPAEMSSKKLSKIYNL